MGGQGSAAAGERYASGQHIGPKYRLVRRLDEGGMGTVWVAHNVDLDVHVAIKLIRGELGATAAADRLLNEARILARLEHPAIIRVFDCGRTDLGDPFIAMELLSGESLGDALDREVRLDPTRAVQILLPIADAIGVAHERGIVHRDIKPDNIFLCTGADGRMQPKILDFGIARADVLGDMRLTAAGTLLGSPAYMSPEQARGKEVDTRSDVWALSVVLYEMLTGVNPFEAGNYNATLRAIIEDPTPSPVELGLADPLLSSIIERGLAKRCDERFQSVRELGSALAEWLWSQGVQEDAARVSLRAAWLSRPPDSGDAAISVRPVTLPGSDPPSPRSSLPVLRLRATPDAVTLPELRVSTSGVAISSEYRSARPRSRWPLVSIASVLVLGLAGAVVWQSLSRAVPAVGSASSVAPALSRPAPEPPPIQSAAPPVPSADAGAAESPAPEPTVTVEPKRAPPAAAPKPNPRRPPRRPRPSSDLKIPY